MDRTHVPADLASFRKDLDHCHVIRVFHDSGQVLHATDCIQAGPDDFCLVLEPSIVIAKARAGGSLVARAIPLAQAVMFEFDPSSCSPMPRWVRDPNGIWLRVPEEK